jgi:hypothetical protein
MESRPTERMWSRAVALLLVINLIVMAGQVSTVSAPGPQDMPEVEPMPQPEVVQLVPSPAPAIHVSLWWNEQIAQRDLDLVQEMGFRWIKQAFAWRDIETNRKGYYDWWRTDRIVEDAVERDLFLIVRLDRQPFWSQPDGGALPLENAPPADLQDFQDFCFATASRYRGKIKAYQVWNEPNLAREWGEQQPNPAEYVELLKHCYTAIKKADPNAIVISAGLAPTGTGLPEALPDDEFLRGMYEAGGAAYFDMLGLNAPGYAASPQTSPEETASNPDLGGHRWNAFRHVEDMREIMVEYGDGHKQVAILEMGWTLDPHNPEYAWFAVTREQQAEYLAGAYWWARLNWQPWIGIMTTIYIPDPYWTPDDEEYWWSITLPTWPKTVVRPAYEALSNLPDWSGDFYDKSEASREED